MRFLIAYNVCRNISFKSSFIKSSLRNKDSSFKLRIYKFVNETSYLIILFHENIIFQ